MFSQIPFVLEYNTSGLFGEYKFKYWFGLNNHPDQKNIVPVETIGITGGKSCIANLLKSSHYLPLPHNTILELKYTG